ncbi:MULTISPECIES: hypothetical protein [Lactobacillaceae]|uniref:hypothetical protein n=1 Tax=Lactobacillaceae TaxID=33958 RepID=UPI0014574C4A|nr:hypothetical protein [Lactobacillus sp. HBUAS51381]NLR08608.1 hypothetical protein [Lactobacillus sp. HBUAS51381]
MIAGLTFTFHGGTKAFIDQLAIVINDLDDEDIHLLDQITQWSWTNNHVIPAGEIELPATEIERRLTKFERLHLLDYGKTV